MSLTVDISGDVTRIDPDPLGKLLDFAFQNIDVRPDGEWEMSILLADSGTIAELHGEFFDDPTDTDVMSFPSGELESGDGNYLGDIAISTTMAVVQALDHQHSFAREVAFLSLHGLLHLLGFDDLTPAGKQEMLDLQEQLLSSWEQDHGVFA